MEIEPENIIKLARQQLVMLFCVISCGVGPGMLVILYYWPDVITDSDTTKLILLSLLAAAPVIMPSFVFISVLGHASGKPRTTQTFMTEFTFALFACFLSYVPALIICYLFGFGLNVFIVLAIILAVIATQYFVSTRSFSDI
jgi:hypothetical protein